MHTHTFKVIQQIITNTDLILTQSHLACVNTYTIHVFFEYKSTILSLNFLYTYIEKIMCTCVLLMMYYLFHGKNIHNTLNTLFFFFMSVKTNFQVKHEKRTLLSTFVSHRINVGLIRARAFTSSHTIILNTFNTFH